MIKEKRGKTIPEINIELETITQSMKLVKFTPKYMFVIESKHDKLHIGVSKRNSSDIHVGTFKFSTLAEAKEDKKIKSLLPLIDIDDFFKTFGYEK